MSKKTEKRGITTLRTIMDECELLDYKINESDSDISWDGYIDVYKDSCEKKEDFEDRISLQVKAKTVSILKQNIQATFDMDRSDLNNYYKIGGTMLVLIKIIKIKEKEIRRDVYVSSLLPYDINKLLKENEKKISVSLNLLKDLNAEKFQKICLKFSLDKSNQGCMNGNINIEEIKAKYGNEGLQIFNIPENKNDFFENILNTEQYLYVTIPNTNITVPVDKVTFLSIVESVNKEVKIKNKIFYSSCEVIREKNNVVKIVLGKAMTIIPNNDKFIVNISANSSGLLSERIKDIEFLIELFDDREIYISNQSIIVNLKESADFNIEKLKSIYKGLLDLKKLLEKLNIKKDINMDNINESDKRNVNILLKGILREEKIELNIEQESKIFILPFLGVRVALFLEKQSDKLYKLKNIFSDWCKKDEIRVEYKLHDGKRNVIFLDNVFLILESKAFTCDNFEPNIIYDKIIKVKKDNEYYNNVIFLVLGLINAYDSSLKMELLDLSDKLIDWLIFELGEINVNILNKMQVKYRKGTLEDKDYETLIHIKSDSLSDNMIMLGASILLKSEKEITLYISKLTPEENVSLKTYPIYNLIK